jgi:hypothetical protein
MDNANVNERSNIIHLQITIYTKYEIIYIKYNTSVWCIYRPRYSSCTARTETHGGVLAFV